MRKHIAIFILVIGFGLLINPFITFWFVLLYMFIYNNKLETKTIMSLSYASVIILAFIYSSRLKGSVYNDDFPDYYENFARVGFNNWIGFFIYGSGIEMGLPVLNFVIKSVFGIINQMALMFIHSSLITILLVYAFQKYFLTTSNQKNLGVIMAFTIAVLPIFFTTQLIRQSYMISFVILALRDKKWGVKFFWLLLGTIFHTSALLYFAIFQVSKGSPKMKYNIWFIILFSIVLMFIFKMTLNYLVQEFYSIFGKIQGFYEVPKLISSSVIIMWELIVISLMNVIVNIIAKNNTQYHKTLAILIPTLIVVSATLDMNYFAYRFALLFSFFIGYFFVLPFTIIIRFAKPFLLIIMLWYAYVMIKSNGDFRLWSEYNIYELVPIWHLFS